MTHEHISGVSTQGEVDRIDLREGVTILIDREASDDGRLRVGVYAKGSLYDLTAGRSVFVLFDDDGQVAEITDEKAGR